MATYDGNNEDNYKAEVFSNEAWTMYGRGGNDTLYGGYKADSIYGDAGDDVLFGYRGNDSLYGGTGNDSMVIDDRGDLANELPRCKQAGYQNQKRVSCSSRCSLRYSLP